MNPKKIVFWAPYIGHVGTIKAVINSASALKKYGGHQVSLIKNHSEWEGLEGQIQAQGISIIDFRLKKVFPRLHRSRRMGSRAYMLTVAFFGFFQLRRYLQKEKPAVLITSLIALPALLAVFSIKIRPKIIVSIQGYPKFLGHNTAISYKRWMKWEDRLRKWFWNRLYRKADLVICMTESTRRKIELQTSIPKERLVVITNPVIDDAIFELAQEKVQDSWFDAANKVVAVGRLTRQKDFLTLIRAVAKVLPFISVQVAILGEGEERDLLEKEIVTLGLSEYIKLYGFVSNPYPFIKKADLFVLSSLWEDPGHAILEAAALQTPIVSTDCPSGPSDLLSAGEGGELCPVGDVEIMSYKIKYALENPSQAKVKKAYENSLSFTSLAHYEALKKYL